MTTQTTQVFSNLLLTVAVEPQEVGRRIRHARDAKGWTQLDFALRANVSPSSVQRWEAGKLPRVRELMRIADLLDVPPDALVAADEPDEEVAYRLDRIEQAQEQQVELLQQLVARLAADERAADT